MLIDLLGSGAFGEVWSAHDLHRGAIVALKLLLNTAHRVAWREATLLTTLNSPHILKINNADIVGDVPFIDTKLARTSLDRLAEPLGLEPHRAVEAIRRVLRGLSLCHSLDLLHRDVKPANVFEDTNGDIVLGDFGVAILLEEDGRAPVHGDSRIVAPEGWSTGRLDHRADLYSCGVTLFALLTGRWPFDQATRDDLVAAVSAGSRPPLRDVAPHVSQALDSAVKKALAVDPQQRFQTAAEFDSSLGRLPARANRFIPMDSHPDHHRCWIVQGRRRLTICAVGTTNVRIQARHDPSGRRVADLPDFETTHGRLAVALRRLFDQLR